MIAEAQRLGIDPGNILVLDRDLMIGITAHGRIYVRRGGQWRRLIESSPAPATPARRRIRYSGHHDSARSTRP